MELQNKFEDVILDTVKHHHDNGLLNTDETAKKCVIICLESQFNLLREIRDKDSTINRLVYDKMEKLQEQINKLKKQ